MLVSECIQLAVSEPQRETPPDSEGALAAPRGWGATASPVPMGSFPRTFPGPGIQ